MLTACFDAGGKETTDHDVLTVAGFATSGAAWSDFEHAWLDRLQRDGLAYFHAGDFTHSVEQFRDWKADDRRRAPLTRDLLSIIKSSLLRKFGGISYLRQFDAVRSKRGYRQKDMEIYAYLGMKATEDVYAYAESQGIKRNVRCVFEKGDPESQIRKLFKRFGYPEPDFTWSREYVDRKGVVHDPFIGLQAAGWIAYEYYLDAHRLQYEEPRPREAFDVFESLPGNIVMHLPKDDILPV